jgi:hypothetical protein
VAEERGNEEEKLEAAQDQTAGFTFTPDYRVAFSTVYSNFALVSHTGDDLAVDFCLIAPPYRPHSETKTVPIPVVARVIISPGLAQGLLDALRIQLGKQTSERQSGQMILPVKKPSDDTDA